MSKVDPAPAKPKAESLNWCHLFKYSTCCEKIIVGTGVVMAILGGALLPTVAIVMAKVVRSYDPDFGTANMLIEINTLVTFLSLVVAFLWFFAYFQYAFL